jgi:hypothetical protein
LQRIVTTPITDPAKKDAVLEAHSRAKQIRNGWTRRVVLEKQWATQMIVR